MMFLLASAAIMAYMLARVPVRAARSSEAEATVPTAQVETAMVIDLAAAVIASGASIPSALLALERALDEEEGEAGLAVVARLLLMGASWEEAWADAPSRFVALRDALAPSWESGAAPVPLLERASASLRACRARASREAAAALAAKLVLPLGLCFLPAFVLLGVVPVVASTGMSIFSP